MAKRNKEKRARFNSVECVFLDCTPGNADHARGAPISIVTLAGKRSGDIFPVMLTLADTRKVAVELLVSLYTAEDTFAEKVLMEMFPDNDEGHFHWPKDGFYHT